MTPKSQPRTPKTFYAEGRRSGVFKPPTFAALPLRTSRPRTQRPQRFSLPRHCEEAVRLTKQSSFLNPQDLKVFSPLRHEETRRVFSSVSRPSPHRHAREGGHPAFETQSTRRTPSFLGQFTITTSSSLDNHKYSQFPYC